MAFFRLYLGSRVSGQAPEPPVDAPRLSGGRGKRRRQIVEIDGEQFPVDSPEEARELLIQARNAIKEVLADPIKQAVNGKLTLKKPQIQVIGDKGPDLTEIIQAIAETRKEIAALYREASRNMEIAHYLRMVEDEEEIEIMVLM